MCKGFCYYLYQRVAIGLPETKKVYKMKIAAHIAKSVKADNMNATEVFDAILECNASSVVSSCPFNLVIHFEDKSLLQVMEYSSAFALGISPRKYAIVDQDKPV